jgi:hypothetical protein
MSTKVWIKSMKDGINCNAQTFAICVQLLNDSESWSEMFIPRCYQNRSSGVVRMELRWNAREQSHFLWWLHWENDSAEQMGLVVAWYLWSMEHSFNSGLVRAVVGSVGNWQAGLGHHCLAMFPRVFLPIGCRVQQVAYLLMGSLSAGGKTGDRLTHVRRSTMTIFQVDFHWTVAFLLPEWVAGFDAVVILLVVGIAKEWTVHRHRTGQFDSQQTWRFSY